MPELKISIGGREFQVACMEGEEQYLLAAAKLLNEEAQVLNEQVGRMPEGRMLLMAGLMLADKTASFEDQVKDIRAKLEERDAELEGMRNMSAPEPERVEVPVIPDSVVDALGEVAARVEALAAEVEEKAGTA